MLAISICLNIILLVVLASILYAWNKVDKKTTPEQAVKLKPTAPPCPICGEPIIGKLYRSAEGRWGCHHCMVVKFNQITQGVN